jgi:hypothetical protein
MPVVLTGYLDKWPAYGKWSIDFFRANYADAKVGALTRSSHSQPPAALPHCGHSGAWHISGLYCSILPLAAGATPPPRAQAPTVHLLA